MIVHVFNGARQGEVDVDRLADAARVAAESGGHRTVPWTLRDHDFSFCRGCFRCWVATPGTCSGTFADRDVARRLADGPPLLVGLAEANPSTEGRPLYNAAALLAGGAVRQLFRKTLLPTYDVFDEDRYFEPARGPQILELGGRRFGVSVCEDVWNDRDFWRRRRYHSDPLEGLTAAGAACILNLSASPFTMGKQRHREKMLSAIARKYAVPVLYVNQVGGADELVFDGRSCAFAANGRLIARAAGFAEDVLLVDLEELEGGAGAGAQTGAVGAHTQEPNAELHAPAVEPHAPALDAHQPAADDFSPASEVWRALVLGVRDYVAKSGFHSALLGLSGGIDSALVAAVAAEALGPQNVLAVLMPSPYSSPGSVTDACALAERLGIASHVRFLGFRRDVPDLIHAADVFVLPSYLEGLCSTLIDVMLADDRRSWQLCVDGAYRRTEALNGSPGKLDTFETLQAVAVESAMKAAEPRRPHAGTGSLDPRA